MAESGGSLTVTISEVFRDGDLLDFRDRIKELLSPKDGSVFGRFCQWYTTFSHTPVYEQWDIQKIRLCLQQMDAPGVLSLTISVFGRFVFCQFSLGSDASSATSADTIKGQISWLTQFVDRLVCLYPRKGLVRLVPEPPNRQEILRALAAEVPHLNGKGVTVRETG